MIEFSLNDYIVRQTERVNSFLKNDCKSVYAYDYVINDSICFFINTNELPANFNYPKINTLKYIDLNWICHHKRAKLFKRLSTTGLRILNATYDFTGSTIYIDISDYRAFWSKDDTTLLKIPDLGVITWPKRLSKEYEPYLVHYEFKYSCEQGLWSLIDIDI